MHEQSLPEQRVDAVDKNTLWKSLGSNWDQETLTSLPRKEKRKTLKKLKRKQMRRDAAEKERTEEETRLNDPAEQRKIQLMEEAEAQALQIERMEHERQEKLWLENQKKAMEEAQRKQQEELEREKAQKEAQEEEEENWEYIEEGPAEIIWQGNEIIVRKKRVRVPKGNSDEKIAIEDSNRPTSNPLPPQCAAFADYRKLASSNTSSMIFDGVEQQIPNFGTEQDKAHCPFHIKTGACRFGTRCSRAHFYPDKSCTLLMKNMYNGPGLTWEQDEGLEYTDEEVAQHYQEFYEDVHTEFLKFGEIVNFKVCRNGSAHLRGNVYVHYKSLDSAVAAYNTINGRFFAGKQITCDFIGVTRWKVAICGEYMKSRHKNCSHGSACNFLHCFRNPGGEYDWADWDSPPPRSWMIKMDTLFGRLRDGGCDYWKQRTHDGRQGRRHSDRRTQSSSNCRISRKHKVHERDSWSDDDSGATLQREHSDGGKYSSRDEKDMNSDLDEVTYHRRIDQRSQCNSRGGGGRKKREDWETSEEDRINIRRMSRRNNSKTHRTKRKRHHRQQTYEEDSDGRKRTTDSSDIDLADKKCSESKSCTRIDSDHSPEHLGPWLKERDMLRRDRDKESSHDEKKRRRRPSRRGQGLIKSSNMDQDKIKSSRRSRDHSKSPRRYRDHGKSSRVHRDIKSTRRGRDGSRPQRGDEDQSISPMRDQHSIEVPKSGKDSSMIPQRICKEDSTESVDRWQASDGSQSEFGQMI